MKGKILLAVVCIIVGAAGALLVAPSALPVSQAACVDNPCASPPCCNGDVNGSGEIDIADAISVLSYLFARGPEPKAIACQPPSGGMLPATGQAKCYMGVSPWSEIDCASVDYPGQDGFYQAGCPTAGRFVDHGDGTVTDTCTGLVWQKETAPGTYNWRQALQYCDSLELGEHADWRLPNVRELQSIVDYGRFDPAIDTTVFGAGSSWYWSSSTFVFSSDVAWVVDFGDGVVGRGDKGLDDSVRAVRSGP